MRILMKTDTTIQIFRSVLTTMIGTTRGMSDEGADCSKVFILDQTMIEEIAENLSQWWNDKYGDDETTLTTERAAEFLEETYPETDENTRQCNS